MPMHSAALPKEAGSSASLQMGGFFAFLLLGLGVLVMQSRFEWTYKPQYYYGWGVPLLSLYLFAKRWNDRPEPGILSGRKLPYTLLLLLILLWLPFRILREANMDWRLLHWLIGLGVVGFMLTATWMVGGKSWLQHFRFPILFLLVSITWPSGFEGNWVAAMSRFLVILATEFLNILGWPAWSSGNIIYLPGASVGMEDACSGIRSFQTAIMMAFFLGELSRLRIPARAGLVFAGVLFAFLLNLARTLTLTFITARSGNVIADKWHDPLGFGILALSFVLLYGVCNILKRRFAEKLSLSNDSRAKPRSLPVPAVITVASLLVVVELATELWYRRNDPPKPFVWAELRFPKMDGLIVEPISERIQSTLACTSAQQAVWKTADAQWWIYLVNWSRGAGGNVSAYFHNPEVCLPNAGLKLVEKQSPFIFQKGEHAIEHDVYLFQQGKEPMYVFYGRRLENKVPDQMTMQDRFARAIGGKRLLASQMIEVSIGGVRTREAAEEKYRKFLHENLHFKS